MSNNKVSDILGPVDSAFYYVDRPETPMNIGSLMIFEGKIDYDQLLKLIDSRMHHAPLYRKKIIQAPMRLGQPIWVYDPDFYIENHVFKVTIDPPGSDEQLRKLAGNIVSGMLDRHKPLWEIHLIEGLENNRTGMVFKVHHCMVDGLSAVEIFSLLFDFTPDVKPIPKKPVYDPPYLPSRSKLVTDAVRVELPHKWHVMKKISSDLTSVGVILRDKEKRRRALVGLANLVNDNMRPIKKLPINGTNTGRLTLGYAEFSLAEVRAIKSSQQSSVNDVMLSVLGHALELYSKSHDANPKQDFTRVLVPVNMRAEDEKGQFGNRISVLPIDIPFGIEKPLDRLKIVTERTNVMKQSALSITLDMVLSLPSLAPAVFQPIIWSAAPTAFAFLAHTWCTNVAGPQIPMYVLGHELLHSYGYFPLNPSMGMACVVMSYNQKITMTIIADSGIVPKVMELKEHLETAYLALRKAAKVQVMEPIALERPSPKNSSTPAKPAMEKTTTSPTPTVVNAGPAVTESRPEAVPAVIPTVTAKTVDIESVSLSHTSNPLKSNPIAAVKSEVMAETQTATISEVLVAEMTETEPPVLPTINTTPIEATVIHAQTENRSNGKAIETALDEEDDETELMPSANGDLSLFSEAWAQAYQKVINTSVSYYEASKKWEAGSLAFVIKASPTDGFPEDAAVLLDLYHGKCREAHRLPLFQVEREAAFIIEGDYRSWMKVLGGKAQPLTMLMRGKLKLKKGSMSKLMPFTKSAQELVNCARGIS